MPPIMKAFTTCLMLALALFPRASQAVDLREATFTQVVNSVTVTNPKGGGLRPAQVNTKFATPEVIRTGANSRAELTAADQTVTRVGANTIFSFKPEGRGINLQQGSVLFNSPTGRGGGTIQTAAATASVLGTTIIVACTSNGGFKLLVLEGKAKATLQNGRDFTLKAGQMSFITPNMTQAPQVFEFRLGKQNDGSNLLKGFTKPLPAEDKVKNEKEKQEQQIAKGEKTDTGLMVGDVVGNEIQIIDPNLLQTALRTLAEENGDADLIKKLQAAVTVDRTVSGTLDPTNALLFERSTSFLAGLLAIDAQVGLLFTANDNTVIYAAKNLTFTGYTLDLSPYSSAETFAFFGKESLTLPYYYTITGFGGDLVFHSDGELNIPGYTNLFYSGSSLSLEGWNSGGLNLSVVTVSNSGSISISNFGGDISISSGTYTGSEVTFIAGGNVAFTSSPTFNTDALLVIAGDDFTMNSMNFTNSYGSFYVSAGGTATISTNLNLGGIAITAGDTVSMNGNNLTAVDNISLIAGVLLELSNSTLLAGNSVLLNGQSTLNLGNVNITSDTVIALGDTISSIGNIFTATSSIYLGSGATSVYLNNSTLSSTAISVHTQTLSMSSTTMTASGGILSLFSTGTASVSGNTLYGDGIEFTANTGTLSTNYIYANNSIDASASGLLTLSGNSFNVANSTSGVINVSGNNIDSTGDIYNAAKIKMYAVAGTINVTNGTFTAKSQLVVNGKNININTATFSSGAANTGTASFSAGMTPSDVLNISNANFNVANNFNSVSMQAYTINLTNVDLSAYTNYVFKTFFGGYNFGAPTPGTTNLNNVSVGGTTLNGGNIGTVGSNLSFPAN